MTSQPTRGRLLAGLAGTITLLMGVLASGPAFASSTGAPGQQEVDQSTLVPTTLDSSFAPFDCRATPSGVVCTGERHIDNGWGPSDLDCGFQAYERFVEDVYQTRYYDLDNLNDFRTFRQKQTSYLATASDGPATGSISTDAHYTMTFGVPGDDRTITQTTKGVLWEVRESQGQAPFRVVGTLVEPYDDPATFTGVVTIDGATSRYVDAPLDEFFDEAAFFEAMCQAAAS